MPQLTPRVVTPNLQTICTYWQKRLRLQDWDIKIKYERFRRMQNSTGQIPWGQIQMNQEYRSARILILHPSDNEQARGDIEETVVHELLHIHFSEVRPQAIKPGDDIAEERVINALAQALITLHKESA